jgi:hypothetical protein
MQCPISPWFDGFAGIGLVRIGYRDIVTLTCPQVLVGKYFATTSSAHILRNAGKRTRPAGMYRSSLLPAWFGIEDTVAFGGFGGRYRKLGGLRPRSSYRMQALLAQKA